MAILLVKAEDALAEESPARWHAGDIVKVYPDDWQFGRKEIPSAGLFYHILISNLSWNSQLARDYETEWRHEPILNIVNQGQNNRRVQVNSNRVSRQGRNGFTDESVANLLARLERLYQAPATLNVRQAGVFQFTMAIENSQLREFEQDIIEEVRNLRFARRVWTVSAAGLAACVTAGGTLVGTQAEISPYLINGIDD